MIALVLLFVLVTAHQRPLASSPREYPPDKSGTHRRIPRQPDPARIEDTLARFLYDWPDSSSTDRAAMARFFGFFEYEPALKALRREASRLHGEAAVASLQALAAMGDVDSVALFRESVRSSGDCEAVRIGASALGEWEDHNSYSTLLLALMKPRCEGPAVVEMVQALLKVRHPFLEEFLFLIHQGSTSHTARLAAAAALAPRVTGPRRRAVESTLRTALHAVNPGLGLTSDGEEQRLLLAVWGMGRYAHATCREANEYALALFEESTGPARKVVARALLLASLPCFKQTVRNDPRLLEDLLVAADDAALSPEVLEQLTDDSMLPRAGGIAPERIEPAWVDWLVQLATRFTLWDETRSVAQFAQAIERLEWYRSRDESTRPSESLGIFAGAEVPRPKFKVLDELSAGWQPRSGFDDYDYTPYQPAWWPGTIDVTIDDGPRPRRLRKTLRVLNEHGVRATFFFIGVNVLRAWSGHPESTRTLLHELQATGHRIGYHSMAHQTAWRRHLQGWTAWQIRDDIELFRQTLDVVQGEPWTGDLGRLPGGMGRQFRHVHHGFELGGLKRHVHWDIQDPTWGPSTSSTDIRSLARRLVRSGEPTVILLHEYEGLHRQLDTFIREVKREVERVQAENG